MSTTNFGVAINNIATTVAVNYTYPSDATYPTVLGIASAAGISLSGSQFVRISTFRSGSPLSILKATAPVESNGVAAVTFTGGGTGYSNGSTVTFTPTSGGSGATARVITSGGVITEIVVTASGSGYSAAPTVSISGGSGATGLTAVTSPSCLPISGTADGYSDVNLQVGDAAELRVTAGAFTELATAVNNLETYPGSAPASGVTAGSYTNTNLTVDSAGRISAASNGSGGGDILAVLTNTPVSVTGTTALSSTAFDKMHVCSGTSSNYTVTLPSPTGNAGKFIGFRMDPALTKLVTITHNASENIDGIASRIMWTNETAILGTDGTNWYKIAGKSIPMACQMAMRNSDVDYTIANTTQTVVPLDRTSFDNTGQMADTTNHRINLVRAGTYTISGVTSYSGLTGNSGNTQSAVLRNTVEESLSAQYAPSGGGPTIQTSYTTTLGAVGDYLQLQGYQNSGASAVVLRSVFPTDNPPYPFAFITNLLVKEDVAW